MINFEEELAKFKPSLEVDETEKAILNDKMVDITDILQELMNEIKNGPVRTPEKGKRAGTSVI